MPFGEKLLAVPEPGNDSIGLLHERYIDFLTLLVEFIHILKDLHCEYQNNYLLLEAKWENG